MRHECGTHVEIRRKLASVRGRATIPVALGSRSYDVLIGPGLIDAAGGLIEE